MLGDYDECLSIEVKNERGKLLYQGKHCMIKLLLIGDILVPFMESKEIKKNQLYKLLQRSTYEVVRFYIGLCIPSTCTAQEISQILRFVTKSYLPILRSEVNCETNAKKVPNTEQIVIICIFAVFGFLLITGTCFDFVHRSTSWKIKSGYLHKLLLRFSLYTNTIRLFSIVQDESTLPALNGCRVLSAFWIIHSHVYLVPFFSHFIKYRGLFRFNDWIEKSLSFKAVTNSSFGLLCDVFFLISGTLFLYTNWRKPGLINLLLSIIRKTVRILRIEMLVVSLTFILPLISDGPISDLTLRDEYNKCKKRWWHNILLIQNFWPLDQMCLFHTWFISALVQVQLLTFCVVTLLSRRPKFGIAMNIMLILIGCMLTGILTYYYHLPSAFSLWGGFRKLRKFFLIIHTNPNTYIHSYCIGMFLGYVIIKKRTIKIKTWIQMVSWIASTFGAFSALYGSYYFNVQSDREINIIYAPLHRVLWSVSVAWALFACTTGHGGLVGKLLSLKVLVTLDRLCLMIYLIHPLIIIFYTSITRSLINLGIIEQTFLYFGTVAASVILSYILNVTIEQPMNYIDSYFSRRCSRNANPDDKQPEMIIYPVLETNTTVPTSNTA